MLLGGKLSGDYLVADLADFEAGAPNVRVYQVKELIQPTDITSPLAGIAKHVELISPGEEFIVGETGSSEEDIKLAAPPCRAYTGTTRPAYIGSEQWKALQYSERFKIAAAEAARRAAELRESEPPDPAAEDDESLSDGITSHSAAPIIVEQWQRKKQRCVAQHSTRHQ